MDERTMLRYVDELQGQIDQLRRIIKGGELGGTKNYNELENRPYINGKLLTGNKNSKQIGVAEYITAEDYADLTNPSEHEIYFVSDRPEVVAWGFTKPTAQINWTEGDNTYTATVSAAIGEEGEFYKSIISATVDDESVTIESSELEHSPVHAVVLSISCDDPEAITATGLDFMFSFAAETGQRQIIHNGMQYGSKFDVLYSSVVSSGNTDLVLSKNLSDYDFVCAGFYYTAGDGNSYNVGSLIPIDVISNPNDHSGFDCTFYQVGGRNDRWVQLKYKDDNTLTLNNISGSTALNRIFGVKFN